MVHPLRMFAEFPSVYRISVGLPLFATATRLVIKSVLARVGLNPVGCWKKPFRGGGGGGGKEEQWHSAHPEQTERQTQHAKEVYWVALQDSKLTMTHNNSLLGPRDLVVLILFGHPVERERKG